jgi:hydroxymethylbilane synthase
VNTTLTIGSRGSTLALWQAHHVSDLLGSRGVPTRIQIIKTTGDHLQAASLVQAGGKGLFTKEIEDALLAHEIDIAVHSLKDLPTESPAGLVIAAIPERADPHDALLGFTLDSLPRGAHVGTSSLRRSAQLLALRPDLRIEPIRGNVDTRVRKLKEGQYEAIVLAAAGLKRLGKEAEIAEILSPQQICPAPGQGALAIQTRESGPARYICEALTHHATEKAVHCERRVLASLGGGCRLPIGAYAVAAGNEIRVFAAVISPDGKRVIRREATGEISGPERLGDSIALDLTAGGAAGILELINSSP